MPIERPFKQPESARRPVRLDSWKEIAAYLSRDVRTVQRWERTEDLPVHRHLHGERSAIYAFPDELDAWWNNRPPRQEPAEKTDGDGVLAPNTVEDAGETGAAQVGAADKRQRRRSAVRLLAWLAPALTVAAGLAAWKLSPGHRTDSSPAGSTAVLMRRVWEGPEVDVLGAPTPDGRSITFRHPMTNELAVRDLIAGSTRILTPKISAADRLEGAEWSVVSPDGRQVAYSCINQDGFIDVRLIPLEDSAKPPVRVLVRNTEFSFIQLYGWSPSGESILAVVRDRKRLSRIVKIAVSDGAIRVLQETAGIPAAPSFLPTAPMSPTICRPQPARKTVTST